MPRLSAAGIPDIHAGEDIDIRVVLPRTGRVSLGIRANGA